MKISRTRVPSPYPLEASVLARGNFNLNSKNERERSAQERSTPGKTKSRQDRSILDIVDNIERGGRSHMPLCYTSPRHAERDVRHRLDGLAEEQDILKDGLNNLQHLDVDAIQHTLKTLVDQMTACSNNVSFLRTEQEKITDHYKGLTKAIGTSEKIKLPSIFQSRQPLNTDAENGADGAKNHSQNASKVRRNTECRTSNVGELTEERRKETDGKSPSPAHDQPLPNLFKSNKQIKAERRHRIANRLREIDSYEDLPVYVQTATGGWRKPDRKLGDDVDHRKNSASNSHNRQCARPHKKE